GTVRHLACNHCRCIGVSEPGSVKAAPETRGAYGKPGPLAEVEQGCFECPQAVVALLDRDLFETGDDLREVGTLAPSQPPGQPVAVFPHVLPEVVPEERHAAQEFLLRRQSHSALDGFLAPFEQPILA